MKEEIEEFLRDRFAQRSNATYISLSVIFSLLSVSQDNIHLFRLGLLLFLLAIIFLNSIYLLISQKIQPVGFVDSKGKQKEVVTKKYPNLRGIGRGGLLLSAILSVSLFFTPDFRSITAITNTETPTATVTSTFLFPSPTSTLIPPTSTYTSTPTFSPSITPTFTSTITSTFTTTPSFTPTLTATPTINPMVFRGLDQECLIPSLWTPIFYETESKVVDSRNCWDLEGWGIVPADGGLNFDVTDSIIRQDLTRRFNTRIKGDAEIKFTVKIKQFTTRPGFDGMLMLGVGNTSTVLDSGHYIKYTVLAKDNKVYRTVAPGLKTSYDPRSEYIFEESQNIIIRIIGDQVKIIADGHLLQTKNMKADERPVFWIVYSLPSNNGSLTAEVSAFQINDHR